LGSNERRKEEIKDESVRNEVEKVRIRIDELEKEIISKNL